MLSWFIKESRIVSMGVTDFRILFSTYIFLGLMLMAITLMQSLGKASKASVLVLLRQIVLFVPLVISIIMLASEFRNLTKQAA